MVSSVYLSAITSYFKDNIIYFSSAKYGGLFAFDVRIGKSECLLPITGESYGACGKIVGDEEGITIYPFLGNRIIRYCFSGDKTSVTDIPSEIANKQYCLSIYSYNEEVCLFPSKFGGNVLLHNRFNNEISIHSELTGILGEIGDGEELVICSEENMLYVYSNSYKTLYSVNMNDYSVNRITVIGSGQIAAIYKNENDFWLTKKNTLEIEKYSMKNEKSDIFYPKNIEWQKDKNVSPYANLIFWKGRVIAECYYANGVAEIDDKSKEIRKICDIPDKTDISAYGGAFGAYEIIDDYLYILPVMCRKGLIINNAEYDTFSLTIDRRKVRLSGYGQIINIYMYEQDENDLKEFIEYIEEQK